MPKSRRFRFIFRLAKLFRRHIWRKKSQTVMRIRFVNAFSKHKSEKGEFVQSPSIDIRGKWVARLGFRPLSRVKIYGKDGLIVIKLLKD